MFNPSSEALIHADVHFNDVHQVIYQNLLEDAIQFCKGKQNVLLGQNKYRNDVFYKLVNDLKKHFKVIEVAIEKDQGSMTNISKVAEVYVVKKPEYSEEQRYLNNDSIRKYATKKYNVTHVLFPLASNLNEPSSWTLINNIGLRQGNEPWYVDEPTTLDFYFAFLIIPAQPVKVQEYYCMDDDDDADADADNNE